MGRRWPSSAWGRGQRKGTFYFIKSRGLLKGELPIQLKSRMSPFAARLNGAIMNNSGTVIDHITYDPWGNPTDSNPSAGDRYKFTGQDTTP